MKRTEIKICGIRRAEDCDYVNEAEPDYAGFIFWEKSVRNVSMREAYRLRKQIKGSIRTVGVFVNEVPEFVYGFAKAGIIQAVQLHGAENEAYIAYLRSLLPLGTEIWKAFKVRGREDIDAALSSTADRILLDNGYGTGKCFDHSLMDDESLKGRGFILAGGMTPENIPEAIAQYAPDMIDISSGVETDGFKDRDKILRAVQAVRGKQPYGAV